MRRFLIGCGLIVTSLIGSAEQYDRSFLFGLGVFIEETGGICGKYWLNEKNALNIGIGFKDLIYGDYLWHNDNIRQPRSGRLTSHYGLGLKVKDYSKDTVFGLRGVGGISYELEKEPIEFFLEPSLFFKLSDRFKIIPKLGLGIRYWFK